MIVGPQTDRTAFLALNQTTALHQQDYPAWHRGRRCYAVWMIDVAEADILAYIHQAREHFADMLFKPFVRQPHVTVFVSGFWVDQARWDDDYTPVQYQAHIHRLQQLTLPAFDIVLGAINSFASALYVEVHDIEQGLSRVRQALQEVMPELRWAPYVPHVTIGVYSAVRSTHAVVQRIQQFAPQNSWRKRVRQVHLSTYSAQEFCGPLHTLYTHTFVAAQPSGSGS